MEKERFEELVAMTELYLLQTHASQKWLVSDPATHQFFLDYSARINWSSKAKQQDQLNTTPPPPIQKTQKIVPPPQPQKKTPQLPQSPKKREHAVAAQPQKKDPEAKAPITLYSPSIPPAVDFSDFRSIFRETFPSQKIIDEIPCGIQAEVYILAADVSQHEYIFLKKIAKAITDSFCPAVVISKDDLEKIANTSPRLVITQEILKKPIPTLQMLPPKDYLNDPSLKRKLWDAIKRAL